MKINPFAAFMQEKYEADRASEGPTVEVFYFDVLSVVRRKRANGFKAQHAEAKVDPTDYRD